MSADVQVPFIGGTDMPVIGGAAAEMLQYCTHSFASTVMRKTGEQIFLLDGKDDFEPLIVSLTLKHLSTLLTIK